MIDERVRLRPLTLLRGWLCVLLALAFITSAAGRLDAPIEHAEHDRVSAGGQDSPESLLGRGSLRIVKRLVGIDHWAINAVVPDDVALAPALGWLVISDVGPRVDHSCARHRGTPVRGPPNTFTI